MKRLFYLLILSFIVGCSTQPEPGALAAQAAKAYYDALLQGRYEEFVDGRFQPDSIPGSYREQLLANARMFVGQQQELHRGIREVRVANAAVDTSSHTANVFLVFVYGDSTHEEVVVPMVEHRGVWYRR